MRILVKLLSNEQYEIDVGQDVSIEALKDKIVQDKPDVGAHGRPRLMHQGKVLQDGMSTIGACGISPGDFIVAVAARKPTTTCSTSSNAASASAVSNPSSTAAGAAGNSSTAAGLLPEILKLTASCQHPHVKHLFGVQANRIAGKTNVKPAEICAVFSKYTSVTAPNGVPVHIVSEDKASDAQLRVVQSVVAGIFTNVEGGVPKAPIFNACADAGLIIPILNSEKEARKNKKCRRLHDFDLFDQVLFVKEVVAPDSREHLRGSKDATWEEVLHNVQNYGLRQAAPDFQAELDHALQASLLAGRYIPDEDYNSWVLVSQEFFAVAMETYCGMSETRKDGMSGGEYIYCWRDDMERGDPETFALIRRFFPPGSGLPIHPDVKRPPRRRENEDPEVAKTKAKRESARRWWAAVALARPEHDPQATSSQILTQVKELLCSPEFNPKRACRRCKSLTLRAAASRGFLRAFHTIPADTEADTTLCRLRSEMGLRQRRLPREAEVSSAAAAFCRTVNCLRAGGSRQSDCLAALENIFNLFAEGSSSGPRELPISDLRDLLVAIGMNEFEEAEDMIRSCLGNLAGEGQPLTCQQFIAGIRQMCVKVDEHGHGSGSSSGSSRGSSRSSSRGSGSSRN